MKRVVLLLCIWAFPAAGQELFPRFSIGGGVFFGDFATDIRADVHESAGAPAIGTEILLERDLGLDPKEQVQRFSLHWRPFHRHELSATFFSSDRHGLLAIERTIRFEDDVFPVRAEVATDLSLDYWSVAYTGWLMRRERYGLGLTLAVMGLSVDTTLTGRLPDAGLMITEGVSATVPLALVGAEARFALTRNLVAEGSIVALPRINYDVYSGRAVLGRGSLEYRVTRNVAVGAAYNHFVIDGTFDDPEFSGRLDHYVDGIEAHLRLIFGQ